MEVFFVFTLRVLIHKAFPNLINLQNECHHCFLVYLCMKWIMQLFNSRNLYKQNSVAENVIVHSSYNSDCTVFLTVTASKGYFTDVFV